ncbi:ABC transporter substrate-binding protein [Polynucleobacter paneuropaeus]|nr:ABC transporter substrate-binding protein [Polynucleobacter paneuropaeus]
MFEKIKSLLQKIIFYRHKWAIYSVILIGITAITATAFYPRTTLRMAAHTSVKKMLHEKGEVNPEFKNSSYYKLQKDFEEEGIKLEYITQSDNEHEKSSLEFLISQPDKVDFASYLNLGAELPKKITDQYRSIGVFSTQPIYFITKSENSNIHYLKDLKGKKITFWTSPEGSKNPPFTINGDKASIYSSDLILEQIFAQAGVTPTNSKLLNTWPNPISMSQDWDVIIALSPPNKDGGDAYSKDIYDAVINNKVHFIEFSDVDSLVKHLPHLKVVRVTQSLINSQNAIPRNDFKTIGYTQSYFVNKNLDPSLVLIMAEVIQNIASKPNNFRNKNEYPNFSTLEMFPPHEVAQKYYREGDNSFLGNYFSPTFKAFIEKLLLILGPVFLVIYPIVTLVPEVVRQYCMRKIAHWYEKIYAIEREIEAGIVDSNLLTQQFEELDKDLREFKFPFIHEHIVQQIYIAREHIKMIKEKLN